MTDLQPEQVVEAPPTRTQPWGSGATARYAHRVEIVLAVAGAAITVHEMLP